MGNLGAFRDLSKRRAFSTIVTSGLALLLLVGCDEEEKNVEPKKAEEEPAEVLLPVKKSSPSLSVDEAGPQVRGMSVMLLQENGSPNNLGLGKLRKYLEEEKEFLTDKELTIQVDRKAPPAFVATFLTELAALSPAKIFIETQSRGDFPKKIEFVPQEKLENPDPCSLVGTITEKRGTAIWHLKGGTARKRSRGMGGPDLSMTAETIESMSKKCDSDLFFISAFEGVDWGLVYDLGGAGLSVKDAGLKRAVLPTKKITAGNALDLK